MGFKRFDPEDFVVSADTVTSTVWSNNTVTLNTHFTSSIQKEGSSGPYYLNIYQTESMKIQLLFNLLLLMLIKMVVVDYDLMVLLLIELLLLQFMDNTVH
jgi:hypothetical protein